VDRAWRRVTAGDWCITGSNQARVFQSGLNLREAGGVITYSNPGTNMVFNFAEYRDIVKRHGMGPDYRIDAALTLSLVSTETGVLKLHRWEVRPAVASRLVRGLG